MRRAVVADQAGAVHREHHVELLQADVVDDLVVRALQEGRIDRAHRLHALERHAGREQHRVLLRDADVVVVLRHLPGQRGQAGAACHRGGDPDHARVIPRLVDQCLAEHLRVLRWGRRPLRALVREAPSLLHAAGLGRVPLLHALEAALLRRGEPLALHRLDVDDHRAVRAERLVQGTAHRLHVVAVDHADVGEVELLEEQAGRPERLDRLLQLRAEALDALADAGGQLA